VKGRRLDQAVLRAVIERVLTADYVLAVVEKVNGHLAQDNVDQDRQLQSVKQQLADVELAISNLLDLAERSGAQAAATRLMERESERDELVAQIGRLKGQRDLHNLQVDPDVIRAVLVSMRSTLEGDDLQAKRVLLRRFVERVEVTKEEARVVYTFPIPETVNNIGHPWGYYLLCVDCPDRRRRGDGHG
jgi:hypothetical protein